MRRLVIARYLGGKNTDPYYDHNKTYPMTIKTRLFSKKVRAYKRRGYLEAADAGSIRDYRDMDSFKQLFRIEKEDTSWLD